MDAKGSVYLHKNDPPFVHRALKQENTLLDRGIKVKIADFSLAHQSTYKENK